MKKLSLNFTFLIAILLSFSSGISAQVTSGSLGSGTSSSATRGPFQRSDNGSSSVHSRANLVYTAAELASVGVTNGAVISQINWDLGSTNVITATGDATVTIYMKNSSITDATLGQWSDFVSGATQVGTHTFNLANNFPGVEGFLGFPLATDFAYTGGTIEVLVEWDCSGLTSTNGDPNLLFSGNGSLNWHWDATTHNSLVYRAGTSSPPSSLTNSSGLKAQRVNTQFVTIPAGGSMQSGCVGTGTSSSATRGPFQRSDNGSSSVYSRANLVYTEAELAAMGITSGSTLTDVSWDLGSTNVITATGDAIMDVYMKNSSVTDATLGQWSDIVSGSTQVGTYTFNLANNFPGVEGFVDFQLATGFIYTGGTLEILVDWDCSGLTSTNGDPNLLFSGNGSLNWHWDATTHNSLVYRAGSSSPPSSLTNSSGLKAQRVNTCLGFTTPPALIAPTLECRQPTSTVNTPGLCGAANVTLLPPFVLDPDNVGGFTYVDNAPSFYPIGTTLVTYTLTNTDGSTSVCEKEVIIADNESPAVSSCSTIIEFINPNTCMANVSFDIETTDNCGIVSITGNNPQTLAVGLYEQVITITDANGNIAEHLVIIEVHDDIAPEFNNCPSEQITLNSSIYPASMIPTASDNCGLDGITNDIPEGGLAVGESIVTFTAVDTYGNTTDCVVNVLIEGDEIISLHPTSDIGATLAEDENSQIVTWNPLNATTQCSYCEETSLEGFTFIGNYWGHQYFLANEVSLTRQDAQLIAEGYDAHLAVISDAGENNYLKEALSNEVRTAWIGLMPQNVDGAWSFVWDNDEVNVFDALDVDMNTVNANTRIILSQDGNWINATNTEEKHFLIERPCVNFTQAGPMAPNTSQLLRSGDVWPEGDYEVTYAAVDMCGNESQLTFDVNVQPEVSEFCTTEGTDNSIWIEGVTFHEMTNTSTSNEGYADFAEAVTTMNIGDGVVLLDLTAGGNTTEEVLYWRVWLDKNNDGDFFDSGEVLFEQSTENAHLQANVALAQEAVTNARLRVAVARHAFPAPCGNPYVGEVEDYTITLTVPAVIDVEREAEIYIFPNPADTYVNVDVSDFAGEEISILITNALGKSVSFVKQSAAIKGNVRLDLQGMTGGMYNISISTNKRQITKRFVVSNVNGAISAK